VHIVARYVQGDLGFLYQLLNAQRDFNINDVIKVIADARKFVLQVIVQSWSDFQMMAGDMQIHDFLLKIKQK
jgi:hypothetical protein